MLVLEDLGMALLEARSQGMSGASSPTSTRRGRVLMKRPIIDSMPASGAERPDTVVPKTHVRLAAVVREE